MCKCRFYVSVCIDKQRWNSDKCEYECKELNVKGKYDLFGIQVILNVNMINHVILESIQTMKMACAGKN